MYRFLRSLLFEIAPPKSQPRRPGSLLDRRAAAARPQEPQQPLRFGKRGPAQADKSGRRS